MWAEHVDFCKLLRPIVSGTQDPLVVAEDFNQRIPRRRAPEDVFDSLERALDKLNVVTAGDLDAGRMIDHVASSSHLEPAGVTTSLNVVDGNRLTDHSGCAVDYRAT